MALRQAKGKYCFVLNDDTELRMPVIDLLFDTIENIPEDVAVISPRSVFGDGTFQSCGRDTHTAWKFFLSCLSLYSEKRYLRAFMNSKGSFETGDIVGAFFLIKTDLFRKVGFFDERYFFCPEDIALGYELRKLGYKHYVNSDVQIIHYEGMSGGTSLSMTRAATAPASTKGQLLFYAHGCKAQYLFLAFIKVLSLLPRFCYHKIRSFSYNSPNRFQIMALSDLHSIYACFSSKSAKELFLKFYQKR